MGHVLKSALCQHITVPLSLLHVPDKRSVLHRTSDDDGEPNTYDYGDSFMDDESGKRLTFDQAQAPIRDYLHTKAMRMAVAEYIKVLSYNASIKGFELENL